MDVQSSMERRKVAELRQKGERKAEQMRGERRSGSCLCLEDQFRKRLFIVPHVSRVGRRPRPQVDARDPHVGECVWRKLPRQGRLEFDWVRNGKLKQTNKKGVCCKLFEGASKRGVNAITKVLDCRTSLTHHHWLSVIGHLTLGFGVAVIRATMAIV